LATLSVPDDFGSIEHDKDDDMLPYKVRDYYGNEVGNFSDFSRALLALVIVNSHHKKIKANSLAQSTMGLQVDKLYYSTIQGINQDIYTDGSYFDENNDLVIGLGGINQRPIQKIVYQMPQATTISSDNIDPNNPLLNLTVKEVYERWFHDKQYEDISKNTIRNYSIMYKKIQHLADRRFLSLRFSDLNNCVLHEKDVGNSFSMRKRVKLFFSQLYQWAIAHEMCTGNIALNIKLGKNDSDSHRQPFSIERIHYLFEHAPNNPFMEEILMLILCGCRIGEFLNIKRQDIHMDQRYFIVTESKTKVGRGRIVPIHKKVMKFYRKKLRAKSEYLIHDARGRKMDYETWSKKFKQLMKHLGWTDMSVHGCRHTCATLLHTFGADIIDEKQLMGHCTEGIHERVYLHQNVANAVRAIDCIKI